MQNCHIVCCQCITISCMLAQRNDSRLLHCIALRNTILAVVCRKPTSMDQCSQPINSLYMQIVCNGLDPHQWMQLPAYLIAWSSGWARARFPPGHGLNAWRPRCMHGISSIDAITQHETNDDAYMVQLSPWATNVL